MSSEKNTTDSGQLIFWEEFARIVLSEGYTTPELSQILKTPESTIDSWRRGVTTPIPSRQLQVLAILRDPRTPPSERKLAANHLYFDKAKNRFNLRFTVDLGPKVIGKRVSVKLNTKDLRKAIELRDHIIKAFRALGLTVRPRVQKRKGGSQ